MKKLSATLIFLLFSINLHAQILMSDDFEGPIIDPAKWLVWEGYRGGIVEQEDGKIVWKHLDAITPGTGHGIQTVDAFQDGGIYVIEGDYESNEPNFCLQMGEGGTGISITSISPERENYYYGYPTPSITVYLHGNISYTYGPQASQGYYIHDYNRIFENEIYKTECEILHGNDIFYFYKKQIVRLKVLLDTDNRTIKLYGDGEEIPLSEASFTEEQWDSIIGASGEFKVEEFRSWGRTSIGDRHPSTGYPQHSLDNWSISKGDNQPPVVSCSNIQKTTTTSCFVDVTPEEFDNGSSDPDGDEITLSLNPPGPFSVGETPITLTVSDGELESSCQATITVIDGTVPSILAIQTPVEPLPINESVVLSATFEDLCDSDDHTAIWDWGNGTSTEGEVNQEINSVAGNYAYTLPGVYTVMLTVTDGFGNTGTATATEFIVIYDPDGGFVTGGGWIDSPAGAYIPEPSLVGKSTFGFISKYKKGQIVPTGETEFQFHAGDLNFHSSAYDWLVIANHKAMYKGVGTIKGDGNFGFQLSAIDADKTPSTDVDLFRMRIWDKDADDILVYDNKVGETDEYADPTTAISGGNIKIHDGKLKKPTLEDAPVFVEAFDLEQNYPNPFNPETTINYMVPEASHVELAVYNITGAKVKTLVNASHEVGRYSVQWNGTNESGEQIAGSVYLCKMRSEKYEETIRMLFLK